MATYYSAENVTGAVELLQYANTAADGRMGGLIVLAVFFVSFFIFKEAESVHKTFAVSSFLTAITAIFMWVMNVLNPTWVYVSIIMAIVGFLWLFSSDG